MFIAGNKSTGICERLTPPTIAITRQMTTIKYGVRIAKPDMLVNLYGLPFPQARQSASNDYVALFQAGANFYTLIRFKAECDRLDVNHPRSHRVNPSL